MIKKPKQLLPEADDNLKNRVDEYNAPDGCVGHIENAIAAIIWNAVSRPGSIIRLSPTGQIHPCRKPVEKAPASLLIDLSIESDYPECDDWKRVVAKLENIRMMAALNHIQRTK